MSRGLNKRFPVPRAFWINRKGVEVILIAIIDYGVGNLHSLAAGFRAVGAECGITADKQVLSAAERVVLPGVGAFGDAMAALRDTGLAQVVRDIAAAGTPLMGICLGMQLLFERSYEYGVHNGLGLIDGEICSLAQDLPRHLKVPHIGWNALRRCKADPLLAGFTDNSYVYYVHSYYLKGNPDCVAADSEYHVTVPGLVRRGQVCGTQFHPEKSGKTGLAMLAAFAKGEQV